MKIRWGVILLAMLLALPGCYRRPMDVYSANTVIRIENDYTLPFSIASSTPDNYRVMMYDAETMNLVYDDYAPEHGGEIKGVPGKYICAVYNFGTYTTRTKGEENARTMLAYSPEADENVANMFQKCVAIHSSNSITKANGYGMDGTVVYEPDEVFVGVNDYVNLIVTGTGDETNVIDVSTAYGLAQGELRILGITGLEYVASAKVYVTNLAKARYIFTGEVVPEPIIIPFDLAKENGTELYGSFKHFGILPDKNAKNMAYVVITDKAGKKFLSVVDVTDQIRREEVKEEDENFSIVITLDFDIPDPGEGAQGGGFAPEVGEWSEILNEVSIG